MKINEVNFNKNAIEIADGKVSLGFEEPFGGVAVNIVPGKEGLEWKVRQVGHTAEHRLAGTLSLKDVLDVAEYIFKIHANGCWQGYRNRMNDERDGGKTVNESRLNERLVDALEEALKEMKQAGEGEKCDHDVNICFCELRDRIAMAEDALYDVKKAASDERKVTAEDFARGGVEFVEDGDYFLKPEKNHNGEWEWVIYGDDWERIGNAPGKYSASAVGYAAFLWGKGFDDGYKRGQSLGANNAKRQIRNALGIDNSGFDHRVLKVLDDYGVARPTNI